MPSGRLVERATVMALRAWGFSSRWIPTDEGLVHVLERPGTGPATVLLHGMVASGADYFPLLVRLVRSGHHLVAPDLPGHGLSPAPRSGMHDTVLLQGLVQALDAVLPAPAVVFGNSMGGFAALRLAGTRPDLVRGLVLASPGGAPVPGDSFDRFLDRFRITDGRKALAFARAVGAPFPSVVAWGVRARFSRPETVALIAQVTPERMLTADELRAVRHPTLVLWGKRDRILPVVQREFFRAHLPGDALFEEPAHLGHAPFLDDADFVARRLERFVRSDLPRLAQASESRATSRSR